MEPSRITPAIIIWQNTLKEVPLIEFGTNGRGVDGYLENWHQKLKDVVGYKWANSKNLFQTQLMGHFFSFSIHYHPQILPKKNFHWKVNIWDMTGSNSILEISFPSIDVATDLMPNDIWLDIISHCEDFINGKQDCSGCKKQMYQKEIAGKYYAGVYCGTCWENKYKKIEAADNYE